MRLSEVHWIKAGQLDVLKRHHIETLAELASLETRDSLADVVEVDGLRALAKRARRSLGWDDPMEQLGAAVGQRGATVYAGGVRYGLRGRRALRRRERIIRWIELKT